MSGRTGAEGGATPDGQLAAIRHQAILAHLAAEGQVSTTRLARDFGVTHETVRKDLLTLQDQGVLRRVHGGAVPSEPLTREPPVETRTERAEQKERIARAALRFLPEAGAVLIDSGSTTAALARVMPSSPDLVVVTNSLPIALTLLPSVGTVTTLGGRVRRATSATADEWARRQLEDLRGDVAFLGANALSLERGLSTPDQAEAALKSGMIRAGRLRVLLADHTKIGRESLFRYAGLDEIDVLITDEGLSPARARQFERAAGIEVVRA